MGYGSLQNNKRGVGHVSGISLCAAPGKYGRQRHVVYLTAKLVATQIKESSGAFGAICRNLTGNPGLQRANRLARVLLHLSDEINHL